MKSLLCFVCLCVLVAVPVSGQQILLNQTLQNAATANGTGTVLTVTGLSLATVQVVLSTFTGTINFEGSADATNFVGIYCTSLLTGGQSATTTSAGIFLCPVSGLQKLQARISGYVAGSATVTANVMNYVSLRGSGSGGSGTVTNAADLTANVLVCGSGGNAVATCSLLPKWHYGYSSGTSITATRYAAAIGGNTYAATEANSLVTKQVASTDLTCGRMTACAQNGPSPGTWAVTFRQGSASGTMADTALTVSLSGGSNPTCASDTTHTVTWTAGNYGTFGWVASSSPAGTGSTSVVMECTY